MKNMQEAFSMMTRLPLICCTALQCPLSSTFKPRQITNTSCFGNIVHSTSQQPVRTLADVYMQIKCQSIAFHAFTHATVRTCAHFRTQKKSHIGAGLRICVDSVF